ncbi:FAD/NAD(P)-binding domain-containing protein [Xylariaceae sp. FL0255]|nr:FAD/NAD(P)-binding domain-containing protein [Xylariaceae sp. FL0255]
MISRIYHPSLLRVSERSFSRVWRDLKSYHHTIAVEVDAVNDMSTTTPLLTRIAKRRAQIQGRKPHVGVVGAGLAGLRCADVLIQHGFQVTILEGRNRLGGRVHQVSLPLGQQVDAGPNWIHGTNDNPIMELAKQTNTATGSWETGAAMIDESGKIMPTPNATAHSTMMWDIIGDAFAYSNRNCKTIPAKDSLWDFFKREVEKRIPEGTQDWEQKRNIVFQIAESWGAFVGNHVVSQSLKYFWLEECIDGENLFCVDTYERILAAISRPALDGAKIHYKTTMTQVESTDNDSSHPLRVHTAAGETLEFDEVVVTCPLGWLKKNADAFNPTLPTRLSNAIANINYGCLEKVYISFPKAFWRSEIPEKNNMQGFIQLLAPNYAPESNPNRWNQEIVELSSFGPSNSHPTLLFYMYGDQSKFLTSEVAKLPSKEKKDAFLYKWFKPYYSRLPNHDGSSPDCQPVGCFATDWLQDDLAGNGSYANFQVGLEEGDKDIEIMRQGLPERGLWLAGEHTAPFVALGTATGAYWSGEAVGRRIAQAYCRGKGGPA